MAPARLRTIAATITLALLFIDSPPPAPRAYPTTSTVPLLHRC